MILFDSNFLIELATKPIKRVELLNELDEYITLSAIVSELKALEKSKSIKKAKSARLALRLIEDMKIKVIDVKGKPIDDLILEYAINNKVYVATLDSELINKLKGFGIRVITLSDDVLRIV